MLNHEYLHKLAKELLVPYDSIEDFVRTYIDIGLTPEPYRRMPVKDLIKLICYEIQTEVEKNGFAIIDGSKTISGKQISYLPINQKIMESSSQVANKFLLKIGCKLPQTRINKHA